MAFATLPSMTVTPLTACSPSPSSKQPWGGWGSKHTKNSPAGEVICGSSWPVATHPPSFVASCFPIALLVSSSSPTRTPSPLRAPMAQKYASPWVSTAKVVTPTPSSRSAVQPLLPFSPLLRKVSHGLPPSNVSSSPPNHTPLPLPITPSIIYTLQKRPLTCTMLGQCSNLMNLPPHGSSPLLTGAKLKTP